MILLCHPLQRFFRPAPHRIEPDYWDLRYLRNGEVPGGQFSALVNKYIQPSSDWNGWSMMVNRAGFLSHHYMIVANETADAAVRDHAYRNGVYRDTTYMEIA